MKTTITSNSKAVDESRKRIQEIDSTLNIPTGVPTFLPYLHHTGKDDSPISRPIFRGKVFTVRRHHRQPLGYSHPPNVVRTCVCCLVFRTSHFQHPGTHCASLLYILIRLLSTPTLFPATTKMHTVDSDHVTV